LLGEGKPYNLALGLLILIVFPIGTLLLSADTTTIHAQVKEKVVVSAPGNTISWEINPKSAGLYTKTNIINIKANTDWLLTVKDADAIPEGYMLEWTGERYGSKRLSNRMKVSADKEVILPNIEGLPIKEGTITGEQGVNVQVVFTQGVTTEDEPLPEGNVYRKTITFVGSPKV
jgi:hypothetical protein